MKKLADFKIRKLMTPALATALEIVAFGGITGVFAGAVVTLYNILASKAEEFSRGYYHWFLENPAFIPLLFLALALGALIVGGVVKFVPMIKGSGIPQTEGATRGLIHFKWWQVLTGMFATSLFTIFMGLSAGSEGPSIMIGGASGYGVSDLTKRREHVRRYQITGGACTGLAVAFNAPLTGMAFAFEEAHKRFTPEVFICSFSSVVFGVLTRNLLRPIFGLPVTSTLTTYVFPQQFELVNLLYVLMAAVVCALLGVLFYFLVFKAKKLFKKITFFKGTGKMLIPFLVGGAFGLCTVFAMGGGHELLQALGNNMEEIAAEPVFSSPLWATLLIVLAMKFIVSVLNMGAGVPCGVFIPMLAVGACIGGLMSLLCQLMGMDPAYSDLLVIISMATFFTAIVKAPITGIVMVVELTWNFSFLLPVIAGVAIGYMMSEIFRANPIYDELLEGILEELPDRKNRIHVTVDLRVVAGSLAEKKAVRDILWPSDALVVSLQRKGKKIVPDGETVLLEGDLVTISAETSTPDKTTEDLVATVGELLHSEKDAESEA